MNYKKVKLLTVVLFILCSVSFSFSQSDYYDFKEDSFDIDHGSSNIEKKSDSLNRRQPPQKHIRNGLDGKEFQDNLSNSVENDSSSKKALDDFHAADPMNSFKSDIHGKKKKDLKITENTSEEEINNKNEIHKKVGAEQGIKEKKSDSQKLGETSDDKKEKVVQYNKDKEEDKKEDKKKEEVKNEEGVKEENKISLPDNFFSPENLWKTFKNINWLDFFIKVLKIVLILICFNFVNRLAKTALNKHIKNILHLHKVQNREDLNHRDNHRFQLAKTIFPIIESVITWALGFLTLLMMAQQLGLDTAPIYGSVLALGFGFSFASQNTIKDIINGLFTLFEGNISVGDYVKIGDKEGYVESMSLRAIVLRYQSGSLQLIPFSQASSIMNCTREFANAELVVTVGHDADFDDVVASYHEVYDSMKKDNIFSGWIKSELEPVVIQKIDHWGINAKSQIKITPDPESEFSMEFYKRLLAEFRKRNVPLVNSSRRWGKKAVENEEDFKSNQEDESEESESVNMDGSEGESED